jgi:hypothetical protein
MLVICLSSGSEAEIVVHDESQSRHGVALRPGHRWRVATYYAETLEPFAM